MRCLLSESLLLFNIHHVRQWHHPWLAILADWRARLSPRPSASRHRESSRLGRPSCSFVLPVGCGWRNHTSTTALLLNRLLRQWLQDAASHPRCYCSESSLARASSLASQKEKCTQLSSLHSASARQATAIARLRPGVTVSATCSLTTVLYQHLVHLPFTLQISPPVGSVSVGFCFCNHHRRPLYSRAQR